MRRVVAFIVFLTLLFSIQTVRAQGQPSLTAVDVLIWPEYDQPSVLVIYHITVTPTTTLPANMTFRIPAAAVKPSVIAVGASADTVTDQGIKYSLEPDGDWLDITIEVTGPAIQIEYYDPSLIKQGQQRQFTYTWPGDYAAQTFRVELQQPYDASQMETNPPLPEVNALPNDLTYHSGNFGPLQAGQSLNLDISYQKKTDSLTVSFMPVSSPPVNADTTGRVSWTTYLPWLIAGLGVLLITGGLFFYFRGLPNTKSSRRRHETPNVPSEAAYYCPQCGTRARPGDRFCRTCGTRIRQADED